VESGKKNLGEIYAARALEERELPLSPISIPKIREARDMVYNGTTEPLNNEPATANTLQASRTKSKEAKSFTICHRDTPSWSCGVKRFVHRNILDVGI